MKEQTIFVIGVIICLLGMLTITTIQRENLIIEKEALEVQNHMLKIALENSEAQVEKISTTIDTLRRELNRGSEWNERMGR